MATVEVKAGRGAPFTDVGEWVVLAIGENGKPISDRACRIYWLLRAHVNRALRDANGNPTNKAYPMIASLAEMIGISKTDYISKALKELVFIGAIEVEVQRFNRGMRQRNLYTVHREPPEGYEGFLSTNEWHAQAKTEHEI
jgi:hypothetical protein